MTICETLLDRLTTEEGRHQAVIDAVDKGLPVKREYVESTMHFCEKKEDFCYAGKLAEAINEFELAIQFYKKNGSDSYPNADKSAENAARCAEKQGDIDRAIDILVEFDDEIPAGELAEKHGKIDRAIELFLKSNVPIKAPELAEKQGRVEQAIELYDKTGWPFEMYRMAHTANINEGRKKKIYDKAIRQLEEIKHYHWAADAADLQGEHKQAKELRKKAIVNSEEAHPLFAAKLADKMGDKQKAKELYNRLMQDSEKEGHFGMAADFALKAGDEEQAEVYMILHALLKSDDDKELLGKLIYQCNLGYS
jgi:tetratricopeptide (TPR) repeat protein